MAFHFTLEAVLRYRESLEQRERQVLEKLYARRQSLLREMEECSRRIVRVRRRLLEHMQTEALPAVEIHFETGHRLALEAHRLALAAQIQKLQGLIREQMQRFQMQRRYCELLYALRRSQHEQYLVVQRRRQQIEQDELHLLRQLFEYRS